MKLLICLITHNRLRYTKATLESIERETKSMDYDLVIVDNNSTDGTQDWLNDNYDNIILNDENYYPGKACNIGWAHLLEDHPNASYLMRCDNDMLFVAGWNLKAEEYFDAIPLLGQLGLDHTALNEFSGDKRYLTTIGGKTVNAWPGNIGGPCIIRREIYDMGARYDETPWMDLRTRPKEMITPQEDVKFSLSMHKYGYIYGHPTEKLAWTFADVTNRHEYKDYYKKTFKERGYTL